MNHYIDTGLSKCLTWYLKAVKSLLVRRGAPRIRIPYGGERNFTKFLGNYEIMKIPFMYW